MNYELRLRLLAKAKAKVLGGLDVWLKFDC